ncbi:MAG TPA: AsmA-like C-terminal region-containing protein [Methylomirabilota bacterium]|nr:AsmA-like C-terminal region-containing protein [Methylomirabilota bacterium]
MSRPLRIAFVAALGAAAAAALVFAAAWFLMPRDWIDSEARRQAAQMKGATVRWTRLTPAIQWFSIGVRIEGLTARVPDVGPSKTDLRANEIFVRLKLLPLLSRRVEVSSAKLDGAWVTLTEQPPEPEKPSGAPREPQFQIQVPRIDFHNLNVRTRDTLGSGTEVKGLSGSVAFQGTLETPTSIRAYAKADSLFWKASAAAANMPLPSPFTLDASLEAKGRPGVLQFSHGVAAIGPLQSAISGAVTFPRPGATGKDAAIAVEIGVDAKPQKVDSGDEAFRGIAAASSAKWSGTASWHFSADGRLPDIATRGTLLLSGLSVHAQDNSFVLDQIRIIWNTMANRTFVAKGSGGGSGIGLNLEAKGLLAPGGATTGWVLVRAPATRLNGIVPNAPKWTSGNVEARATFELRPPAKPDIRWTIRGSGMDGTMQGLAHPVRGLQFDVAGDDVSAEVRSLRAGVGSSTLNLSGTLARGKPLSTGTFHITVDRLIAEEWAPPSGGKAPQKVVAPPPAALPVPIGAFTGNVEIGEVRSGGMRATNISTPVRFDGKDLVASPIKGSIGTGSFEGAFNVQTPFTKPSYALHLDVKRAPVEQIAAGTIPFSSAVSGFLSGALDLSGQGFPSAAPNETLKGLLKGTLEDGKLKLTPTVIAVARALGISTGPEIPLTQETHTVRIQGNKMLIEQARGDLGPDKAEMNGMVGIDHTLDLNVLLRLAPNRVKGSTVLARFAQYARDAEGRLPVGLKITGLDRAPRITVNTEQLMAAATKQLTSDVGKQIMSGLVKGLAHRPDSLRKADSTLAADSARNLETTRKAPADSTVSDPLKKVGDVLKNIFRK